MMSRRVFAALFGALTLLAGGVAPAQENAPTPAAPHAMLTPKVFTVGKWPEGIVATPQGLWVAESGARAIALLNPATGETLRRVTVGRLPVEMRAGADGVVTALIQTDRALWRQPPRGSGKAMRGLPGCPNGLAQGAGALWALTQPACSSESSQLVRIDPKSGARETSGVLGPWGQAVAADAGRVYVAHARPPALDLIDPKTLAARTPDTPNLSLWSIHAGADALFAGGRLNDDWSKGVVVAFDPQSGAERQRRLVDQMIVALVADAQSVVAVGEKGRLWILAPKDLSVRKIVDLATGSFKARAATLQAGVLYLTSQEQFGDTGAVLAISGWR